MARYTKVTIGGKKYYKVQITCPNGKRKTLYGKTVSELRDKEQQFRAELGALIPSDTPTVAEYAQTQLEIMKSQVQHNTFVGYESKVRLYIATPPLGDKRMVDVTPDDISLTLARVAHQSSSAYRTVHMLLRRIFDAARRARIIVDDPTEDVSGKGGKPPQEKHALSDEEAELLLAAVAGLKVETFIRLGLYTGLRREEILALQWECVHLDAEPPYLDVQRAWRIEHNRPVVSNVLKTPAARRRIPIPNVLAEHLRTKQATAESAYVIANSQGEPLSGSQWRNLWKPVVVRTAQERTYKRYARGGKTEHTIQPKLGDHAAHNPEVVYSLDFKVTPHQLRRTYITNLVYAGMDPKTVQYLAGHERNQITMDIYAKVKYNRPEDIAPQINQAFAPNMDKGK